MSPFFFRNVLARRSTKQRPMLSPVNRGIQIGTLIVVIPNGEPAAMLIEKEQITYPFRWLRWSRSGLFPVPPPIHGSEHKEVLSIGAGDPTVVGRQEDHAIDETDIRNLG